jgi:hypothetical protein
MARAEHHLPTTSGDTGTRARQRLAAMRSPTHFRATRIVGAGSGLTVIVFGSCLRGFDPLLNGNIDEFTLDELINLLPALELTIQVVAEPQRCGYKPRVLGNLERP